MRKSLVVAVASIIHLIGLYSFYKGFLLNKRSLNEFSPIISISKGSPLIIIIIDALRYDFLFEPSPLSLPRKLSQQHPNRSRIFKCIADPPTTTLQRLNGMMTGSLPTFIDMGSNFAADMLQEDNLIHQLLAHDKTIQFYGDDTWTKIFNASQSFVQYEAFDSFNVWDLYTVDNGVNAALHNVMNTQSIGSDILIAHYLGLDHSGHRYGPSHIKTTEKLREMDESLTAIIEAIPEDAILFVLGDHGMNEYGDHGGDSKLEVEAGMWIYSPHEIFHSPSTNNLVNQIDLTSTWALLSKVPIPLNNLGSPILSLFENPVSAVDQAVLQTLSYIRLYDSDQYNFFERHLYNLKAKASQEFDTQPQEDFLRYHLENRRAMWAQFKLPYIYFGLSLLFLSLIWLLHNTRFNTALSWPILYAAMFSSNSFTVWEDKGTLFLLAGALYVCGLQNTSSTSIIYMYLVQCISRIASYYTVCREEQAPNCKQTFFNAEGSTVVAWKDIQLYLLLLIGLSCLYSNLQSRLPIKMRNIMKPVSQIQNLRIHLSQFLSSVVFILERLAFLEMPIIKSVQILYTRTIISFFFFSQLFGRVKSSDTNTIVLKIFQFLFQIITLTQKAGGAISLHLFYIQASILRSQHFGLNSYYIGVAFFLLSNIHFFSTGHQATIPSIQWDSAFLLSKEITYPFSPLLVVLNSFGSYILTPFFLKGQQLTIYLLCQNLITFSAAIFAAYFRRHLMVWKIFAPRFMMAGLTLIISDFLVLIVTLFDEEDSRLA